MVKILGIVDILAAFMLIARVVDWKIPFFMLISVGIVLVGKALLSLSNFFGWIDIGALILIILGAFINMPTILITAAIIMGAKGAISLF